MPVFYTVGNYSAGKIYIKQSREYSYSKRLLRVYLNPAESHDFEYSVDHQIVLLRIHEAETDILV